MTRMCGVCNKVEQEGEWRTCYLVSEDKRVTHGYCPPCFAAAMAEIEDFIGEKAICAFGAAGWSPLNSPACPCV